MAKEQQPKEQQAKKTDGQPKAEKKAAAEKKGRGSESRSTAPALATGKPRSGNAKARLREHYAKTVVPGLTRDFGYKNPMAVPKVEKISINVGLGEATGNSKLMDGAVNELTAIAGQKPVVTKAKKSIAAFKLREGMAIGCMVTLRV